jgi:Mce-associated membrane protein
VSKHRQKKTEEEEAIVPSDTDSEPADEVVEDKAAEPSTENADEPTETAEEASESAEAEKPKRQIQWARVFAYGVLPALALLLALSAGYLKWVDNSVRDSDRARDASVQAAKDSTIALLSYKPDTVEKQLTAARDLLTGDFRDSYTSLTNDVVIPGAKQKQISAVATVPAAASVSAAPTKAVVLVFVNQTVVVGRDAPTDTASSVRVTLDKIGGRWLISKFDPV